MRRSLLNVLVVLLGLSIAAPALANPPPAPPERPVILVLGDSLSAGHGIDVRRGWVALLQRRLERDGYPYRVVNASIGGDTTRGGLDRLAAALARYRPRIVIVELGGNDGLRGLSLAAMQANLAHVIERCRRQGARVLLVGVRMPPNYGPAYTDRFHAVYRELAARYRVPLVPYLLAGIDNDPALMQGDGVHPTAAAQPRMLDTVWRRLAPMLERPATASRP